MLTHTRTHTAHTHTHSDRRKHAHTAARKDGFSMSFSHFSTLKFSKMFSLWRSSAFLFESKPLSSSFSFPSSRASSSACFSLRSSSSSSSSSRLHFFPLFRFLIIVCHTLFNKKFCKKQKKTKRFSSAAHLPGSFLRERERERPWYNSRNCISRESSSTSWESSPASRESS